MAWLFKKENSSMWYIGWRAHGRQFRRTTGTSDKEKADRELARVRSMFESHKAGVLDQVYQSLSGKSLASVPVSEAFDQWLKQSESANAPSTHLRYTSIIEHFRKGIGARTDRPLLKEITPEDIRHYLYQRRDSGSVSEQTANFERKVLFSFFSWCEGEEKIQSNPVAKTKRFKVTSGRTRRAFSIEELRLLFSKAPNDFWRYMVLGGFYTGLRMSDLVLLRWGAVDISQSFLRTTAKKTGKQIFVPLASTFRQFMSDLQGNTAVNPVHFVWPEKAKAYRDKGPGQLSNEFYERVLVPCGFVAIRESKRRLKSGRSARRQVSPISFHSLRHSFVSILKVTGGNQAVAKELAGHSSDLVSDCYTHLPPELLSAAINRLPQIDLTGDLFHGKAKL